MEKLHAKDYRRNAHEKTKKQAGKLALIALIFALIMGALSGVASAMDVLAQQNQALMLVASAVTAVFGVAEVFLLVAFAFSWINIAKKVKAEEEVNVGDLFSGFCSQYWNRFGTAIVEVIFLCLWSLLLVVPGIIKSYSYAMTLYIKEEHPEMGPKDCITASRQMMKGHKWQLFCLELSYIWWHLLAVLTLGILELWIAPREEEAKYLFYLNISSKEEAPAEEAPAEEAK